MALKDWKKEQKPGMVVRSYSSNKGRIDISGSSLTAGYAVLFYPKNGGSRRVGVGTNLKQAIRIRNAYMRTH